MSTSKSNLVLVVVPGIMGSELAVEQSTSRGVPQRRVIWSGDLKTIWHVLACEPELLSRFPAQPTRVIHYTQFLAFKKPVYGPLVDFLLTPEPKGVGYSREQVIEFAYDWRERNEQTASKLSNLLREFGSSSRFVFLAHSMGGIVVRLLLGDPNNEDIVGRTVQFVQIASPVLGSATAYFTLQQHPRFERFIDGLWLSLHNIWPDRRDRLMTAVRHFESLFELMPDDSILHLAGGGRISPFQHSVWPVYLRQSVERARLTAQRRSAQLPVPFTVLYATATSTESAYQIDETGRILDMVHPLPDGDGTVTCASAFASSADSERLAISRPQVSHVEICSSVALARYLRELLG